MIQIVVLWCDVTHYSIFKALNLLGLTYTGADGYEHANSKVASLHYIPIGKDCYPDYSELSNKLDDNPTIFIINAPSINTGLVDNIPKIEQFYKNGKKDNEKIWIHVDGAYGMFFIPFLYDNDYKDIGDPLSSFYEKEKSKLENLFFPNVNSISVDLHKMGLIPYPAGVILINKKEGWKYIHRKVGYIAGHCDETLSGSRSGAAVVSAYAGIKELGFAGYKCIMCNCLKLTNKFLKLFEMFDDVFEIVGRPITNVFAIRFKEEFIEELKSNKKLKEIVEFWWIKRCVQGYTIVDTPLKCDFVPENSKNNGEKYPCQSDEVENIENKIFRFVIMPHITDKVLDEFTCMVSQFMQEVRNVR